MLNEGACNFCNIHLSWIITSWASSAFDISGNRRVCGPSSMVFLVSDDNRTQRLGLKRDSLRRTTS
jgi:hypothetical protein